MARKRLITLGCFLVLSLVSIIPAIVHQYIYPNPSEDTANNMTFIIQMANGTLPSSGFRYWGYAVIGYPLYYLSEFIHVEFTLVFTWFHVVLPIIIGGTLYFVFSRLINWTAGLLAMVIPLFVSGATVYYIYQGILFNLINITILYPLLFYFVIKWLTEHKTYYVVLSILFSFIVSTFHSSGIYLPFLGLLAIIIYAFYGIWFKKKFNKSVLWIGISIVVLGGVGVLLLPYTIDQLSFVIDKFMGQNEINPNLVPENSKYVRLAEIFQAAVPLSYFIKTFISIFILWMFGIVLLSIRKLKDNLTSQNKLLIFFLACLGIILLVSAYANITTLPFRQQTDFAIVFALVTTGLIGVLVARKKKILLIFGALICIGMYPQFIPTWFQDNSAIKLADKQAIEYLNTLDYENYNCSPSVSQRIYNNYTKAQYSLEGEILLVRNTPMAQGCDVSSPYWDEHGTESKDGYMLDRTFDDGKVVVEIFRRQN
jgi:hypothetical protein